MTMNVSLNKATVSLVETLTSVFVACILFFFPFFFLFFWASFCHMLNFYGSLCRDFLSDAAFGR